MPVDARCALIKSTQIKPSYIKPYPHKYNYKDTRKDTHKDTRKDTHKNVAYRYTLSRIPYTYTNTANLHHKYTHDYAHKSAHKYTYS